MSGKKDIQDKQETNNRHSSIGFGVAFGLMGGAILSSVVGIFLDTPLIWAFGPGFGLMIGIVIGAIVDGNKNKD